MNVRKKTCFGFIACLVLCSMSGCHLFKKDKSFEDPEERWAFGDSEDSSRESSDSTSREPVFGFGRSDNLGTGLSGPARDIERNLGMRH